LAAVDSGEDSRAGHEFGGQHASAVEAAGLCAAGAERRCVEPRGAGGAGVLAALAAGRDVSAGRGRRWAEFAVELRLCGAAGGGGAGDCGGGDAAGDRAEAQQPGECVLPGGRFAGAAAADCG